MASIFKSRKFWIMVTDVIVSLVTYFVGKYLNPEAAKDILFLIGALQPVILLVIASIAIQNVEGIRADAKIEESLIYNEPEPAPVAPEPCAEPVK